MASPDPDMLQLVVAARSGDTEAWAELASRFVRVLHKEAGYWSSRGGGPVADLVQDGQLGLRHAVDTYQIDRGDFVQHAWAWIRRYIRGSAKLEARESRIVSAVAVDVQARYSPSAQDMVEALASRQIADRVRVAVRVVTKTAIEREVVDQRMLALDPLPVRKLAAKMGLSPARVCQIEKSLAARTARELKKG